MSIVEKAAAIGTYQPEKRMIGQLLSMTSPPIVVPNWQRSYSWGLSHVETFWNDLTEFERRSPEKLDQREYFLGSIVIVATSDGNHLLLDGQQRIATAAILLSVIRDRIKPFKEDAAKRVQSRYLADFDDAKNDMVYKLSLNSYDKEFFRKKILEYRDASYKEPKPEYPSHHSITNARDYFEEVFDGFAKQFSKPEEFYQWALRIQNILMNHMSVVAVTSTDEDSAAEVFETLNDRGIGLSTPDLLRNLVIRRASNDKVREDIVDLWGEVIEFDTDTEIKSFLRHYWISHHGDVKTQRLYREIKSHVVDNNLDSLKFSRELRDAAVIYREIVAAKDSDPAIEGALKAIDELGATALLPFALTVMQSVQDDQRAAVLQMGVSVFVRHSVIGQLENSKLENLLYALSSSLRQGMPAIEAMKELSGFAPDDAVFKAAFARVSIGRTATQRYLLRELELKRRATGELTVNPPHRVHVEHIYPQTPPGGQKWNNHGHAVSRLGNLTLLDKSLNTSIKNGDIDAKRDSYEKSEILLTKELVASKKWDMAAIEERQKAMSEVATSIWTVAI